jgi:hypothetical protein
MGMQVMRVMCSSGDVKRIVITMELALKVKMVNINANVIHTGLGKHVM